MMSSANSDTRTRILDATWKLMERRRGRGVRVGDIARAARVSRQAVYLHFKNRADLLVATVRHVDETKHVEDRIREFCAAPTGAQVLDGFVKFWGYYIPEIYGLAKALLAVRETDAAANAAWNDRMEAVRSGCRLIAENLAREGTLAPGWTVDQATDVMWSLVSVATWEHLTIERGWSTVEYVRRMQEILRQTFVQSRAGAHVGRPAVAAGDALRQVRGHPQNLSVGPTESTR